MRPTAVRKKKAGKKAGANLVPQKHGGAIHQGAPANPVAGPGRPASEIRARLRGSFDARIAVLEKIVDAAKGSKADKTRALELMARYGLGTETTVNLTGFPDVQRAFYVIEQVIRANTSSQVADALVDQITEELRKL